MDTVSTKQILRTMAARKRMRKFFFIHIYDLSIRTEKWWDLSLFIVIQAVSGHVPQIISFSSRLYSPKSLDYARLAFGMHITIEIDICLLFFLQRRQQMAGYACRPLTNVRHNDATTFNCVATDEI